MTGAGIGLIGGLMAVLPFGVALVSSALFALVVLGAIAYRYGTRR
jgi:hypothetical protein